MRKRVRYMPTETRISRGGSNQLHSLSYITPTCGLRSSEEETDFLTILILCRNFWMVTKNMSISRLHHSGAAG